MFDADDAVADAASMPLIVAPIELRRRYDMPPRRHCFAIDFAAPLLCLRLICRDATMFAVIVTSFSACRRYYHYFSDMAIRYAFDFYITMPAALSMF